MKSSELTPIKIERAMEQLRQEQATFAQQKQHEAKWFNLRLVMGYTAILLLASVIVISTVILSNAAKFPLGVVISATNALFVDVISLIVCVWKVVLNPEYYASLKPITQEELLEETGDKGNV